ncbi:lipase chaperone [Rhodococcus sp. A5(2022)]|uniref:lipase chaperone n=1 Tax=Rhodococcus sp. A5(2022) TaxID=3003588 RepID=UPI0022A86320|nr:lipase chaperone [Rhodococcus sp. A5(2022)]MCZ1075083.1 lipase chaperone [Rhodococcus sp. A5(2022)]
MTEYILTATRFDQVLARDEQGRVTKLVRHRRGDTVTGLGEVEVARLLRAGAIVDAEQVRAAPVPPVDDEQPAVSAGGDGEPGGAGEPAPVPAVVPRPKQAADKDDWIAYAISRGWDEADARSMTKPQLLAALAE